MKTVSDWRIRFSRNRAAPPVTTGLCKTFRPTLRPRRFYDFALCRPQGRSGVPEYGLSPG
jgi:hypothetical protein